MKINIKIRVSHSVTAHGTFDVGKVNPVEHIVAAPCYYFPCPCVLEIEIKVRVLSGVRATNLGAKAYTPSHGPEMTSTSRIIADEILLKDAIRCFVGTVFISGTGVSLASPERSIGSIARAAFQFVQLARSKPLDVSPSCGLKL